MSLPVIQLLKLGQKQLEDAGIKDAEIDAKELFCHMMGIDRTGLIMMWQDVLQDNQCEVYFDLVQERCTRKPLQHIVGSQEFMGLTFKVNDKVLIPRQDTETMVEHFFTLFKEGTINGEKYGGDEKRGSDVLDLCCGSGAIGVSIAKNFPEAKVTMTDVSKEAATIAKENASANGCKSVKVMESDMFSGLKGRFSNKRYDYIISNPPYIERDVIRTLEPEVRDYEPHMALDGGEDGLRFYRTIAENAPDHLNKNGILMMEIGYNQKDAVTKILEDSGCFENVLCLKDLTGKDRIVVASLITQEKKKGR